MYAQSLFPAVRKASPRRMGQILPAETPEAAAPIMAQLRSLADTINDERAADAAAMADLSTAGARRLTAVSVAGKAEKDLAEQQRIWEQSHRNADALAAAQAALDSASAEQASAAADVEDKKQSLQQHDQKISQIRQEVDGLIASLPAEMQTDAHRIIDPCWSPRMKGSEPIRISQSKPTLFQSLSSTPRPNAVTLAGVYRPRFSSPVLMPNGNFRSQVRPLSPFGPRLGQLVTVNPNVNLTVQTGIEKYMFPIGLMAGGAASFLVGSVIPESFRPITTIIGLGLVGWGVYTLLKGGPTGSGPSAGPTPPPPPPPTGAAPATASPAAFTPPTASAFSQLQVQLTSPQPDQTIEHLGGIFSSDRIPVVMTIYNPSGETVTFNMNFVWDEFPSMIGYNRAPNHGTKTFQMTLGPNEQKNETFELPYQSSGWGTTAMSVNLAIYKQRTAGENPILISNTTFNVS
jgi:hypothetical protein